MERIPEPEIMDGAQQAEAYAQADFSSSNSAFVDGLTATFPDQLQSVLDIGCGPANIPVLLANARPECRITAVDASPAMLSLARDRIKAAGLTERIRLECQRLPGLSAPVGAWTAIISKDLLHHLSDPGALWNEIARLGAPGMAVYVMDLFRPETPEAARTIVETVSGDEPEILKTDFYQSLLAAFTPDEAREQLARTGLNDILAVEVVSDRHMVIQGRLG